MHKKPRKRVPCHDPHRPPPLIQVLPDQKARVDPTCVPALVCYFAAVRERYEQTARQTLSGTTGKARKIRAGQIAWGQVMCQAIDALATTLMDTIDLRAYDRAKAAWDRTMAGAVTGV